MIRIELPTEEGIMRRLTVGDEVSICGTLITARDAAHKMMVETWPAFVDPLIRNRAIYHCGPLCRRTGDEWKILSAGPTTSLREEPYEAAVIARYGARMIIGKGGMGAATLQAMKQYGAVYVHAIGGASSIIARRIVRVKNVYLLNELGPPEAMWELEVNGMEGVVTMDAGGSSLHDIVAEQSARELRRLLESSPRFDGE